MKPKVWCLGLSRTGTSTLTEILNSVGFNHIHYASNWDMFNGINDGAGDIPVIPVYKELDKRFPNSKFVYTIRDKDSWLKSMEPYLERKRKWFEEGKQNSHQINIRKMVYKDPFFDYNTYSKAYDDHDKDIKEYFKNRPWDLLILDIIGGDKPQKLFDFLNIRNYECPDEFPHYNKLVNGKGIQVK